METDSAKQLRTARHKESKRRYRARQREYVESLEQRLSDSRDQEVAGIKEVQLAAQKVVHDNSRLRALLRFTGVDDAVVESWLRGVETAVSLLPGGGDAVSSHSLSSNPKPLRNVSTKSTQTCSDLQNLSPPHVSYPTVTSLPSEGTLTTTQDESLQNKSHSSTLELRRLCKPVPHILTQSNIESQGVSDLTLGGTVDGNVACSLAQTMLLPFATTDDKVDAISEKLQEGCVISKGGGCAVQASVMWEILEDALNDS